MKLNPLLVEKPAKRALPENIVRKLLAEGAVRQPSKKPAPNPVGMFFLKMLAPVSLAAEQKLGRKYGQLGDALTGSLTDREKDTREKMHAKAAQSLLRVANKLPAPENLVEAAQALDKAGLNLRIRLKERGTSFELALDYVIPIASEARAVFTTEGQLLERLHQPVRAQRAFRKADEMGALPGKLVYAIVNAPGVESSGPDPQSAFLERAMP